MRKPEGQAGSLKSPTTQPVWAGYADARKVNAALAAETLRAAGPPAPNSTPPSVNAASSPEPAPAGEWVVHPNVFPEEEGQYTESSPDVFGFERERREDGVWSFSSFSFIGNEQNPDWKDEFNIVIAPAPDWNDWARKENLPEEFDPHVPWEIVAHCGGGEYFLFPQCKCGRVQGYQDSLEVAELIGEALLDSLENLDPYHHFDNPNNDRVNLNCHRQYGCRS